MDDNRIYEPNVEPMQVPDEFEDAIGVVCEFLRTNRLEGRTFFAGYEGDDGTQHRLLLSYESVPYTPPPKEEVN